MNPLVLRPESIEEACQLLTDDDGALVYGGGTALQILLKQGILSASSFVDIAAIAGLAEVTNVDDCLRIGSMVSLRRMELSPLVRDTFPLASAAYGKVANPRVRNTATVGGNIAHGDYRLDPPVAMLVLGATIELASLGGIRRVPVKDFFIDFQRTDIGQGELVTAIEIPARRQIVASSFVKLSSLSANDWPSASAAAAIVDNGSRRRTLHLAIGALAPIPMSRSIDATGLDEEQLVEAALHQVMEMMDPIPDVRGSVEHKRRLGRVAVEDAVRNTWKELPRG